MGPLHQLLCKYGSLWSCAFSTDDKHQNTCVSQFGFGHIYCKHSSKMSHFDTEAHIKCLWYHSDATLTHLEVEGMNDKIITFKKIQISLSGIEICLIRGQGYGLCWMCLQTTSSNNSKLGSLRNNHLIAFICYSIKSVGISKRCAQHEHRNTKLFCFVSYHFDWHNCNIFACLASEWIALNACFVSLSYFICSSRIALSMNISVNNACDILLPPTYNTVLIREPSKYDWYYSWQLFSAFSDEDWHRQNSWAERKRLQWQGEPRWPYQNTVKQMLRGKLSLTFVTPFFPVSWK